MPTVTNKTLETLKYDLVREGLVPYEVVEQAQEIAFGFIKDLQPEKAESIRSFYFFQKNKCFSGKYRRINKIFHIKILFLHVFQ